MSPSGPLGPDAWARSEANVPIQLIWWSFHDLYYIRVSKNRRPGYATACL